MSLVAEGDLRRAFDDVVAVCREFDGVGVHEKLAQFGIDADEFRDVLEDRWKLYEAEFDPAQPHLMFVQAMTEGVLAGVKVQLES